MNNLLKFTSNFNKYKAAIAIGLIVAAIIPAVLLWPQHLSAGIKNSDEAVLGIRDKPSVLQLQSHTNRQTFVSDTFKAGFKFNALAPHWQEKFAGSDNRELSVRISSNGRDWSEWLVVNAEGTLRDDDPQNRMFPETPIFIEGRYFQYRVKLWRDQETGHSPQITDLKVNYINSETPLIQRLAEKAGRLIAKVTAAEQGPAIISRGDWGSPDPNGTKYEGTNRHWQPTYKPVTQVFLHHTVTDSQQSDPKAVMRAIWDYHANTLGWGDIGYNYVLDSEGRIYEGRFGGDNVVAGHVYKYNRGSLGVAVLGCFQPGSTCDAINSSATKAPSDKVINSLTTLLSWKTTNFEINPLTPHSFCDVNGGNCKNLETIAAHRDASTTSCNGDLFYEKMSTIRNQTDTKNTNSPWTYSAKQLRYENVTLKDDPITLDFTFKNTGSETWSNNDTGRLLISTANPIGRNSRFQGSGWLGDQTPATLQEASVAPGDTGTFTFELKRPAGVAGTFWEGFRLRSEGNTKLNTYFNFKILTNTGHPEGTLTQKRNSSKISLIENGQLRHVKSRGAFLSYGYKWNQVRTATPLDLDLSEGTPLDFREGSLIQGSEAPIYITDYESGVLQKRHIASREVFESLGFSFDEVIKVNDGQLPAADGSAVDNADLHPDGILIRQSGQHHVYLLENGQRRHILSREALYSHGYDFSLVRQATNDDMGLTESTALDIRAGTLVQGDSAPIYVVDYDAGTIRKRHVVSRAIFEDAGIVYRGIGI